jgi:hypothetical protein
MEMKEVGGGPEVRWTGFVGHWGAEGRLRAFATTFSWSGVSRMSEVKFSYEGKLPLWRVDQGEDVRVIFKNKFFQRFRFYHELFYYAAENSALQQRCMPCREFYVKSGHIPHA